MIKTLNKGTTSDSGMFAEIFSSRLSDAIDKHQSLKSKLSSVKTSTEFPSSGIGEQFKIVTELMQTASSRGVKRDFFYVSDDGYDTHSQVDKKLTNIFSQLNPALDAFVTELKALNLWESTTLLQFSEFGRTLEPVSSFFPAAVANLLWAFLFNISFTSSFPRKEHWRWNRSRMGRESLYVRRKRQGRKSTWPIPRGF